MLDVLIIREAAGRGIIDATAGGRNNSEQCRGMCSATAAPLDSMLRPGKSARPSISLIVISDSDWNRATIRVASIWRSRVID